MSQDPEFFYTQAERLVSEGNFAAAELMLRQAAELGGTNRVYVAALAALLSLQEGRADESLSLVEDQLSLTPDEPALLVAKAMAAKATGKPEVAEESLRQVVKANPNHAYAHHTLGKVLVEAGKANEAEAHACKAFALVPDQPDYALAAIELLEAAGKSDYAFEVASIGASFCPQEMELVQKAVEGALAREEPDRAWDALQESNEDLPWVLGWKATLLDHNGEVEKADALLDQGRERFPEDPDFLFLEAAIFVRRQLNAEAMEMIEHLLSLCPTHRGALRLRADLSFGNQSTDEALADLQAMLELDPSDAAVAVELTSAFYRARRYREALDVCLGWTERDQALPAQMTVYVVLCHAGLAEPQEALEKLPNIPEDLLMAAVTELAAFGCNNAAEQILREKLLQLVPAQATDLDDEDEEEQDEVESELEDEAEARASIAGEDEGEPEAFEEERPPQKFELPPGGSILGESPAYDEDEDDEVWVEVDEDGEEYVWVEDDEDEDE
ncbi:tetratricopeptide repeat protein [bacterium]|nr:tetratricopeptide repeat protein [bacterium]